MPIAGVVPTVARDFESSPNSPRGQDDGLGSEDFETAALALISDRAGDPIAVLKQRQHRVLHVNVDSLVNAVILERANHLESGAVSHMRQTRILMSAKVALKNAPIVCAVKHRPPRFEF